MNDKVVLLKGYFYKFINDQLVFFNHSKKIVLKGDTIFEVKKLLPYFNGSLSITQISTELGEDFEQILKIIEFLRTYGIVEILDFEEYWGESRLEYKSLMNFLLHGGLNYDNATKLINIIYSKKIKIAGNNKAAKDVENSLSNYYQIVKNTDNEECNLIIAVDYFENEQLFKNTEVLATNKGIPFIRVVINNNNLHIGPLFIPNEGPCYTCYISRIFSNYEEENTKHLSLLYQKVDETNFARGPGCIEFAVGQLKNQLFKWFSSQYQSDIVGHEIFYNIMSLDLYISPVYKVPGCKKCLMLKESTLCLPS